ncbi:hypothetical protein [Goekera deserti]|uniref:hypothetical protein n=1 Tax=Goekera deserti TaxID=2497753 RepID=UPI00192ECB66|nr:hypothetical protein [Goekera deserti]
MPHSAARRRWLLAHDTSTTVVLERDGVVVATARTTPPDDDVLVAEAAATDADAAEDLLAGLVHEAGGAALRVVDRVGTVPSSAWQPRLGDADAGPEQYYVRLGDTATVLQALTPVVQRRLAAAGPGAPREVLLSTFGASYGWDVAADGSWGPVRTGGPEQSPGARGGAGVAPDALPALLFGQRGLRGLAALRPDVYVPRSSADLFETLFPPVTADLLTYYLPW